MAAPFSPNEGDMPSPRPSLRERLACLGRAVSGRVRRMAETPRRRWMIAGMVGVATVAVLLASVRGSRQTPPPTISYSTLAADIAARRVTSLTVEDGGSTIVATLATPRQVGGRLTTHVRSMVPVRAVSLADLDRWAAAGAQVRVRPPSAGIDRPLQILVVLATLGVLLLVVARSRPGGLRSTKFTATPPDRQLTLADVGGAREAQADLRDVIAYLKEPARFAAMGAKCPKGVLLVGPPGTGKTLLARAVAGEAGCRVITAAGSEFNEMYVGVGAQRVRALANQARAHAPCIVFIDEFDSLGGRRGRPNRTSEEETTLNQLLVEMDGMAGSESIVWMAATNREDMLDPAVRRPGRFDRVVEVGLPTQVDRAEILRIHAAKTPIADDVDMDRLAALTVGYSGAELANLLNEAAIFAVQDGSEVITGAHLEQARDKIQLGRVRSGVVVSDEERRVIALHEAGHAIVGLAACPEDALHKVTIEPRGRSLGAAHFAPTADRHLYSRRYLEGVLAKALGGRAAEVIFLGQDAVTSGAGGDLVQATSVARRMVAEFGMSPEVGLVSADPSAHGGALSAQLQSRIDDAVQTLIADQAARAERLVKQYRGAVGALADALLEREVLTASDVHTIARRHGVAVGTPSHGVGVLSVA
jgi:cell division protease FtsH